MFETLFSAERVLRRHRDGPLAAQRAAYLQDLVSCGLAPSTLRVRARHCLRIATSLSTWPPDHLFSTDEVAALDPRRLASGKALRPPVDGFRSTALELLSSLGRLPALAPHRRGLARGPRRASRRPAPDSCLRRPAWPAAHALWHLRTRVLHRAKGCANHAFASNQAGQPPHPETHHRSPPAPSWRRYQYDPCLAWARLSGNDPPLRRDRLGDEGARPAYMRQQHSRTGPCRPELAQRFGPTGLPQGSLGLEHNYVGGFGK